VPSTATSNPLPPGALPFGEVARRVITDWSTATGHDLDPLEGGPDDDWHDEWRQPVGSR